MRDKSALVFLKPQYPHSSYQIHAWQALKGVPDTSSSFVDDRQIPIDVRSDGGGDMKVTSACQSLQPPASLTPPQGGVIKQANPYIQFASHCYVDAWPVVSVQYVDAHSATMLSVVPVTATEADLG